MFLGPFLIAAILGSFVVDCAIMVYSRNSFLRLGVWVMAPPPGSICNPFGTGHNQARQHGKRLHAFDGGDSI